MFWRMEFLSVLGLFLQFSSCLKMFRSGLNFYIATVSDVAIFDAMGSVNFIEISSSSAKQSLYVVYYSFSVSSMLILWILKLCECVFSRLKTMFLSFLGKWHFALGSRVAVLLKCLFNLLGFSYFLVWLGLSIQ